MVLTWEGSIWIAGAGAVGLVGAASWIQHIRGFRRTAVRTTGRVVENVWREGDSGSVYAPRFEFTARDGILRSATSSVGTSPPSFAVGDTVKVLYSPENPDGARIDSFFQLWFGPLVLGLLASIALVLGLIGVVGFWMQG